MTALGINLSHPLRVLETASPKQVSRVVETRRLTVGLARGEEAAFQQFHELYFDRIYGFLLVLSQGQEHAAQEALQETLLRVARYARVFDAEEVFWSWLKMVARSAARDGGRKRRRYAAMLQRFTLAWTTPPIESGPGENLLHAALSEALQELESPDRHLLEQKYLAGMSTKELAVETGLTDRAVESRLLRLRRHLRARMLKQRGPNTL